jgi:hypothetical protein
MVIFAAPLEMIMDEE